jgi:hypothetical protein
MLEWQAKLSGQELPHLVMPDPDKDQECHGVSLRELSRNRPKLSAGCEGESPLTGLHLL